MFAIAQSFIRDLFLQSGLPLRERLLVVPGNHDVSFFPQKHTDDFRRLRLYRQFLLGLFDEDDIEARRQRYFRVDVEREILFACLDSTLKDSFPLAEGQIGTSQRRWLQSKLDRWKSTLGDRYSRFVKIAILHHHCVPISGGAAKSDRFMQLLDEGDVIKLFRGNGFNIVLHGHRHHPHVYAEVKSDSSVITVIGAGTATCCFKEEQNDFGNNFNLLTISPDRNKLTVARLRADGNGEFMPDGPEVEFPLFRQVPQGYRVSLMRKTVTLRQDGSKEVAHEKQGLQVVGNRTVSVLPLRILSDAPGSKLESFEHDPKSLSVTYRVNSPQVIDGEFVASPSLTQDSQPLNLSYRYIVKLGTAMSQAELPIIYPNRIVERESTAMTISRPTDRVRMDVVFPKGFETTTSVVVKDPLGEIVPLTQLKVRTNSHDKVLNMFTLEIDEPPTNRLISIEWTLPPKWP